MDPIIYHSPRFMGVDTPCSGHADGFHRMTLASNVKASCNSCGYTVTQVDGNPLQLTNITITNTHGDYDRAMKGIS